MDNDSQPPLTAAVAAANPTTKTDATTTTSRSSSEELTHVSSTCSSFTSSNQSTPTHHSMSSERDSDDCYADVGFMFEGLQASTLKRFTWDSRVKNVHCEDGGAGTSHRRCGVGSDSLIVDGDNKDKDVVPPSTQTSTAASGEVVRVALHVVDDEPGALQSGHYLWPAAPVMAEYLIRIMMSQPQQQPQQQQPQQPLGLSLLQQPRNVLELGAGSALLSLTALQIMQDSLQCLVVSDHDPGTLERARDNYETSLEDLLEATQSEEEQMDCINGVASIPVLFEPLEWGDEAIARLVARAAGEHNSHCLMLDDDKDDATDDTTTAIMTATTNSNKNTSGEGEEQEQQQNTPIMHDAERNIFDLLLGSDLIYSHDVVEPLFQSVSHFMTPRGSFLLAQSLQYDDQAEECIQTTCQRLHLQRTVLREKGEGGDGGVRIEQYTWRMVEDDEESEKPAEGGDQTEA